MNRFFTLLLAASCLTAAGQVDSLIGTGFLSMEQSPTTLSIMGCSVGHSYILKVEGLWSAWGGSCERGDGAFIGGDPDGFDSPPPYTPASEWIWNDPGGPYQNNRPSPDEYNVDHVYWFPFVAESATQTFSFVDPSPWDNCGGLTFSIYAAQGCTDPTACNYSVYFIESSDDCDYSCCPGPGCCGMGTAWNWETSECDVANPADINLDGCVQLNDLLDLLSAYGDCAAEESAWQCGDPLEYQGYDYETVQIGEQCWFAENLRAENYRNGEEILSDVAGSQWQTLLVGACAVYGESGGCNDDAPLIDACNPIISLEEFGRLYNGYTVTDERKLCPSSWGIPSDADWTLMTDFLGEEGVAGHQLKSDDGWSENGNGNNESAFTARPSGDRSASGMFTGAGARGRWWSSTIHDGVQMWIRQLTAESDQVVRFSQNLIEGNAIRCIKDTE